MQASHSKEPIGKIVDPEVLNRDVVVGFHPCPSLSARLVPSDCITVPVQGDATCVDCEAVVPIYACISLQYSVRKDVSATVKGDCSVRFIYLVPHARSPSPSVQDVGFVKNVLGGI